MSLPKSFSQSISELEDSIYLNHLDRKTRIRLYNLLAREYSFVNQVKSINNAEKALVLSKEIDDSAGIASAYRILGSIYSQNDNHFQSLEFFLQALDIFKSRNDSLGIANVYVSLGHYYKRLKRIEEQIDYHEKSLIIFRSLGNKSRIGVATHNLAESYLLGGEFEKSRELVKESIQINSDLNKLSVLSSCYNILGKLEYKIGNKDSAIINFEKVLEISKKLGDKSQKLATVDALINLSDIYYELNQNQLMLDYLKQAIDYSNLTLLDDELSVIYLKLIKYYVNLEQFDSLQFYLSEFQSINTKRKDLQLNNQFELIKSVEDSYYLQKVNDKLEKSNLIQATRLQLAYFGIISVLIIIIILVWSLYINIKKNKKLARQQMIIQTQKNHLEKLNNTKNKFFSIVAHDLKSPLNSLKSFTDILSDHFDSFSKEDIKNFSNEIKTSVGNAIKMADNLINWARIQMEDVSVDKITLNVAESVQPIYALYRNIASKKDIDLKLEIGENLKICVDQNQLEFVIRNLLNNAIKFTKRGGVIKLSAQELNDKVEIIVEDNGVGMPDQIKENVFKLESKHSIRGTEGETGTGLGLMLCQEFVNLNEGELLIDSEENKGTTIKIRFDKAL
ncbi:tetratricopeptide repeat-containing sensor histidine kinase [Marivirga arenosa]|uniref:histidine kinase n=1 Tax=Marivirga arenosa TaxID=3059076 RepID=A0AA51X3H0_9BACT|nr:tetratricopeptide repeat-containing sensor histidine kinase [Marivirga sp. BKB1-2]WNB16764.1 tetratricopeptide repeat-containing sensor histidine kinase [Marivirga sp. BKB1-2]